MKVFSPGFFAPGTSASKPRVLSRMSPAFLLGLVATTQPTLVVLNKQENMVWLVDMASGKPRAKLPTGPNPHEVVVSPNQKLAAISNMGDGKPELGFTITVADVQTGKIAKTIDLKPNSLPHGIVWLSDSRLLYTSQSTESVCELDVTSGKVVRSIPTQQKGTHMVVVTPDHSRAFAVNAISGTVSALDLKKGELIQQIPTGNRAEGLSISPDGKWVACGNVRANTVSIIDAQTLTIKTTIENVGVPIRSIFTANGKFLAVSSVLSGSVEIFDTSSWKKITSVELKGKPVVKAYGDQWPVPMNLCTLKSGNIMVVLVTSHAVAEIDAKTWKVSRYFDTGLLPDGVAVAEKLELKGLLAELALAP